MFVDVSGQSISLMLKGKALQEESLLDPYYLG
jgi:hypothetical protein